MREWGEGGVGTIGTCELKKRCWIYLHCTIDRRLSLFAVLGHYTCRHYRQHEQSRQDRNSLARNPCTMSELSERLGLGICLLGNQHILRRLVSCYLRCKIPPDKMPVTPSLFIIIYIYIVYREWQWQDNEIKIDSVWANRRRECKMKPRSCIYIGHRYVRMILHNIQ